jgi:cytoskeletal protein CcmA (bactofilin family)
MRQLCFTLLVLLLGSQCLAEAETTKIVLKTSAAGSNSIRTQPVFISSHISGQNIMVANHLLITQPIIGDVTIIAGKADLQSDIAGDVNLIAGQATIDGTIKGNVTAIGGNIDIGRKAVIEGNLKYLKSSSINVAPGATIKGKLESLVEKQQVIESHYVMDTVKQHKHKFPIIFYLGLFSLGLVLCLAFADYNRAMLTTVWQRPWLTLLVGLLIFIATPMLMVTSLITIIGIPFGIILCGLYFAALWIAYAYSAWLIGAGLIKLINPTNDFSSKLFRIFALVIGLAVLYCLGWIPYLGMWFKVLALFLGLGGIVLTFKFARSNVNI